MTKDEQRQFAQYLIGSIAESRASISFAALLENVTARIPCGPTCPVEISQAMRVVSTRVLPEPAPARIRACTGGRVTAASCGGLRWSSREVMSDGPSEAPIISAGPRRGPQK